MGTLDERNRSLWVATTEAADFPTLGGDDRADVIVVGAGITGLTTRRSTESTHGVHTGRAIPTRRAGRG